ncbi:MAG TPA: hypothetical protein GXZ48_03580 [Acholeplasmataceae bacterium]|nr:hypothetical protein [Acholeplasmataceae bacterium]
MTKKELVDKAINRLKALNIHSEASQILEDMMFYLFPYMTKKGLKFFIKRVDMNVKDALSRNDINPGTNIDYIKKLLDS